MVKQRLTCAVTLLTMALLTAAASCTYAAAPTPGPGLAPTTPTTPASTRVQSQATNGTLASMEGNALALTTAQGQVTVNVAADTAIQKTVAGTLADFQEGQSLTAVGSQNAEDIIVATSITIRPQTQGAPRTRPAGATTRPSTTPTTPSSGARRSASGTLTKIVSNTLTLTTAQGPVTVNVGSNTSIQKTVIGALSDLQEGQSLTVIGVRDASGNISTTSIIIRPPRAPPGS